MHIPIQRHLSRDTSSDVAFKLAKSWLDNCCITHKECANPQSRILPKRVIFVGSNNSDVYLREVEGDQIGRYACLSHCWGNIQPLKTTSQSIVAHQITIPWDDLPKTFQDAIVFCRSLGVTYIWIDSLCIVQDDDDDWASESAKMGLIYAGAIFTIAAMASKDGNGGCFRTDDRKPLEFSLTDSGFDQIKVFVTPGSHEKQVQRIYFPPEKEPEKESPLQDRGWTLQEILLSRRIIYFHKYEIAWECQRELRCECRVGSTSQLPGGACRFPWEVIVNDYSRRSLSSSRDKLPALSGIAYSFKRDFRLWNLGKYYAGLWEMNLVDQLCWVGKGGPLSRPSGYRAPTWSWASVDGECYYYPLAEHSSEYEPPLYYAEVSSVSCTLATIDPYGQVSGGYLELVTLLLPATYHDHFEIKMITEGADELRSIPFNNARIDVDPYYDDSRHPPFFPDLQCAILRYGKEEWWRRSGNVFRLTVLLLEPSDIDQQSYKRIGLANGPLNKEQWGVLKGLLNSQSSTIKII